jgi:hypothetical protein
VVSSDVAGVLDAVSVVEVAVTAGVDVEVVVVVVVVAVAAVGVVVGGTGITFGASHVPGSDVNDPLKTLIQYGSLVARSYTVMPVGVTFEPTVRLVVAVIEPAAIVFAWTVSIRATFAVIRSATHAPVDWSISRTFAAIREMKSESFESAAAVEEAKIDVDEAKEPVVVAPVKKSILSLSSWIAFTESATIARSSIPLMSPDALYVGK